MKTAIQYISDNKGETTAVQLPIAEWERILTKVKKLEQMIKLKSDLKEAFDQVAAARNSKLKKQSLNDFLNEL